MLLHNNYIVTWLFMHYKAWQEYGVDKYEGSGNYKIHSVSHVEWELQYDWPLLPPKIRWTAELVAQFRFATCLSPFSLACTLITDALVCSWARRDLLASLQTWKPPSFCTFFSRQDLTHSCLYPRSGIKRFYQTCIKKRSSHLIWISTVTAEEEGVCDGKC